MRLNLHYNCSQKTWHQIKAHSFDYSLKEQALSKNVGQYYT